MIRQPTRSRRRRRAREAPVGPLPNLDAILSIPVTVQVVLGTTSMPVARLMKLGRGAVISLDQKVGEPVNVLVNGRVVARGEVVVVDEDNSRFGVSLTEIVNSAATRGPSEPTAIRNVRLGRIRSTQSSTLWPARRRPRRSCWRMGKPTADAADEAFLAGGVARRDARAAARLGTVPNAELEAIVERLHRRLLAPARSLLGDEGQTRALLADAVPPDQIADILSRGAGRPTAPTSGDRSPFCPRRCSSSFLKAEHPLTATYILSRLEPRCRRAWSRCCRATCAIRCCAD